MRRFDTMETCLALRAKDRDDTKNKSNDEEDSTDEESTSGTESAPIPKAQSPRVDEKRTCFSDPNSVLKGRDADVAALQKDRGSTGYLHTHPVTQERIRAAEAAAEKSP